MMKKKNNIKQLAESILKHRRLYYSGSPIISDNDFENYKD